MGSIGVKRYDFIDALRGYAILGVVFVHVSQWVSPSSSWLNMIAFEGGRGVQLFFLVSALTLFLSMNVRRRYEARPMLSFALRRFFRIAPMFYAAAVVYTVYDGLGPRYWAPDGIEVWYIPLTLLFLHGWHPETITSVVPGGWTIAVEMTFYLCVPFLFKYLTSITRTLLALFGSLVLAWGLGGAVEAYLISQYSPEHRYMVDGFTFFWFFSQLPIFLMGILLYQIFRLMGDLKDERLGLLLIIISVFLWISFLDVGTYRDLIPPHVLYGLSFLTFSLGLYLYPTQWLVNPLTRALGRISYSVYLTHFGVIFILRDFIFPGASYIGDGHFLAAFVVVLVLSCAISWATYHLVEQPGVALGKRLVKWVNREPVVEAVRPARSGA